MCPLSNTIHVDEFLVANGCSSNNHRSVKKSSSPIVLTSHSGNLPLSHDCWRKGKSSSPNGKRAPPQNRNTVFSTNQLQHFLIKFYSGCFGYQAFDFIILHPCIFGHATTPRNLYNPYRRESQRRYGMCVCFSYIRATHLEIWHGYVKLQLLVSTSWIFQGFFSPKRWHLAGDCWQTWRKFVLGTTLCTDTWDTVRQTNLVYPPFADVFPLGKGAFPLKCFQFQNLRKYDSMHINHIMPKKGGVVWNTHRPIGWWNIWWKGKPDLSNLVFMYPKHPRFKMIVFSWMTPNHYMKNGHVSTFPSIKKMLFRVSGGSFPPWRSTNCILTNFASQVFYKQHSMAFFHAIERTCKLQSCVFCFNAFTILSY